MTAPRVIPLTRGQVTIVDPADFEMLAVYTWHARRDYRSGKYYAERYAGNYKAILMHRQLLNAPSHLQVDHEDGDGLNNRRYNLRLATSAQNQWNRGKDRRNRSGFKGVSLTPSGKWYACICVDGKNRNLGSYSTPEEASAAYIAAATALRGAFVKW